MYISRMLYLLLLSFLSPLLPSLPCCGLSHLVSPSKFKTYAWTCSLLPFPLLLSLSSSCNEAAAAVLLQRCCCNADAATRMLQHGCCNTDAATRMLQRGCCNTDAATRMLQHGWNADAATPMLQRRCRFFNGGSGLIKRVAALAAVNNTSAVWGSSSPLLFAWNLTPEMRICISCRPDSLSGVQLEIIRRATGRFQKTHQSLIWTPPPLIKNSPSRRRLKFFGAPVTPLPPMSLMIFAAADLYLISVGPCVKQHGLMINRVHQNVSL